MSKIFLKEQELNDKIQSFLTRKNVEVRMKSGKSLTSNMRYKAEFDSLTFAK